METVLLVLVIPTLVVVAIILRTAYVLANVMSKRATTCASALPAWRKSVRLMSVLGSGGHTKEMLALMEALPANKFCPRVYVVAKSDRFSIDKLESLKSYATSDGVVAKIPRSREVQQSYISSVYTTLYSIVYTLPLIVKHRPNVLLCNGPGTCVPICCWAFLSKLFLGMDIQIVFIESICRVKTLSLTGKLLYPFVDYFLVQWPELTDKYSYCSYIGRLL